MNIVRDRIRLRLRQLFLGIQCCPWMPAVSRCSQVLCTPTMFSQTRIIRRAGFRLWPNCLYTIDAAVISPADLIHL